MQWHPPFVHPEFAGRSRGEVWHPFPGGCSRSVAFRPNPRSAGFEDSPSSSFPDLVTSLDFLKTVIHFHELCDSLCCLPEFNAKSAIPATKDWDKCPEAEYVRPQGESVTVSLRDSHFFWLIRDNSDKKSYPSCVRVRLVNKS